MLIVELEGGVGTRGLLLSLPLFTFESFHRSSFLSV